MLDAIRDYKRRLAAINRQPGSEANSARDEAFADLLLGLDTLFNPGRNHRQGLAHASPAGSADAGSANETAPPSTPPPQAGSSRSQSDADAEAEAAEAARNRSREELLRRENEFALETAAQEKKRKLAAALEEAQRIKERLDAERRAQWEAQHEREMAERAERLRQRDARIALQQEHYQQSLRDRAAAQKSENRGTSSAGGTSPPADSRRSGSDDREEGDPPKTWFDKQVDRARDRHLRGDRPEPGKSTLVDRIVQRRTDTFVENNRQLIDGLSSSRSLKQQALDGALE